MARIELKGLTHRYSASDDFAIENLDLAWQDGSANALLGPSGCGKTTLLNVLSGLLQPTGGQVLFDGRDVTKLGPKQRHIAQVFQFPVIYDSMTVRENLAFPLRNAGVEKARIATRVEEVAELLGVKAELDTPARLLQPSGKQVVSLGRGIVREDTAAVLLDEPLTVIDPKQRWQLRRRLREVQRATGLTMIYVTHDQHEAITFADHITVMRDGAVQQTGTPEDLHHRPATPFVGYFIGSPGMNLLPCQRDHDTLRCGEHHLPMPERVPDVDALTLGIRPEYVHVATAEHSDAYPAEVEVVERSVSYDVVTVRFEGHKLRARAFDAVPREPGARVWLRFPEEHLHVFDAAKGGV